MNQEKDERSVWIFTIVSCFPRLKLFIPDICLVFYSLISIPAGTVTGTHYSLGVAVEDGESHQEERSAGVSGALVSEGPSHTCRVLKYFLKLLILYNSIHQSCIVATRVAGSVQFSQYFWPIFTAAIIFHMEKTQHFALIQLGRPNGKFKT